MSGFSFYGDTVGREDDTGYWDDAEQSLINQDDEAGIVDYRTYEQKLARQQARAAERVAARARLAAERAAARQAADDAMLAKLMGGQNDIVPIQTEGTSIIGHTGETIQNYVTQNTNVESRPLFDDPDVTANPEGFGIGEVDSDYYDSDTDPSFVDSDSELTATEFQDYLDASDSPELGIEEIKEVLGTDRQGITDFGGDQLAGAGPDLGGGSGGYYDTHVGGDYQYVELEEPSLTESRVIEPPEAGAQRPSNWGNSEAIEMMDLNHRPTQLELSESASHAIDMPEFRNSFNEVVQSAQERGVPAEAIAADMGIGKGAAGGWWIQRATFKDYLLKQGKGVLTGAAIAPLIAWVDSKVDGLGDMLSLGMIGVDLMTTGDPLGILLWGVSQVWDATAQSRQKVIDNDTPDKAYGSRMGYVREGDKWYPAYFNKRFQSTGLLAGDMQMTMDYGEEMAWFMNGEGDWVPKVVGAKAKDFVADKREFDNKTTEGGRGFALGSKDFLSDATGNTTGDITRDWYFLSDEDAKKVQSGELELKPYEDDITEMNPASRMVNDWRKALDYGQDWKWSSAGMQPGAAINTYNGSRGLQRILFEAGDHHSGILNSTETDYDQYVKNMAAGTGADLEHTPKDVFNDYLFDTVIKDHLKTLYKTQRAAAKEAGFDHLYQNDRGRALNLKYDGDDSLEEPDHATPWSSMYLDTTKDLPTASSAEELQVQLHQIELYNDRTPKQRNYLAQKAQMRYWMQQVTQMGQGDQLMHYMYGRDWGKSDPYGVREYTTRAAGLFGELLGKDADAALGDTTGIVQKNLDEMPGFAAPWQNAGEQLLPTLTGALSDASIADYMTDYRAEAYQRMSQEAAANSAAWLQSSDSNLDPNLLLDGKEFFLRPGGLFSVELVPEVDTDPFGVKRVRFADEVDDGDDGEVVTGQDGDAPGHHRSGVFDDDWHDEGDDGGDDFVWGSQGDIDPVVDLPPGWVFQGPVTMDGPAVYQAPDGTIFHDWGKGPVATIGGHEITVAEWIEALAEAAASMPPPPEEPEEEPEEPEVPPDPLQDWIDMGKHLGLLPDDYGHPATDDTADTATPDKTTHVPDKHVATVADGVYQGHSVDDEDFEAPALTSAYAAAIAAAEAT